jgi:AcrR family transcriptional regulator
MTADSAPADRHRGPGRPRDPHVDQAILDAATALLEEGGLRALSVSAVARRSGIARATVYLRWPTRAELLGATAKAAVGGDPYPMTGDLEADLRGVSEFLRRTVDGPGFIRVFPELVEAVLGEPPAASLEDIAPNRTKFAAETRAAAAAGRVATDLDDNLPFDLLLGTVIAYILANRQAPPPAYVERLAEVILRGVRPPGPAAR